MKDDDADVRTQVLALLARLDIADSRGGAGRGGARQGRRRPAAGRAGAGAFEGRRSNGEALLAALKDENADVRAQACVGTRRTSGGRRGRSADPDARRSDHDADARAQAARPWAAIGDLRAADALTAALKDKEPDVRREAAMALAHLVDADEPR